MQDDHRLVTTASVAAPDATPLFTATAQKLSTFRRKTIAAMTAEQPLLRRAALALRKEARGVKLGRRLRRKGELGMAGAY